MMRERVVKDMSVSWENGMFVLIEISNLDVSLSKQLSLVLSESGGVLLSITKLPYLVEVVDDPGKAGQWTWISGWKMVRFQVQIMKSIPFG